MELTFKCKSVVTGITNIVMCKGIHFVFWWLQAFQAGIYYPQYQFVVIGWYGNQWWVGDSDFQQYLLSKYGCTIANRETALAYSISVLQDEFASDLSKVVDSGTVSQKWESS